MMDLTEQTFRSETVIFDDTLDVHSCAFVGCEMRASKEARVSFFKCRFRDCTFFYDGFKVDRDEWVRLVGGDGK